MNATTCNICPVTRSSRMPPDLLAYPIVKELFQKFGDSWFERSVFHKPGESKISNFTGAQQV